LEAVYWRLAVMRRGRLRHVTFIGITGSAGKSTTKDLIGAVLATTLRGTLTSDTANYPHDVAKSVSVARRGDQFRVVEVAAFTGPGALDRPLRLLRPLVGVITNIGTDHLSAFGTPEAIALEKGKLVRALPPEGVAILNADDPRVLAMRDGVRGRVITYGLALDADVRAEHVLDAWPDRLSFDLVHAGQRLRVQTQLCGAHWVSSALAAVAAGIALDVPLEAAARGLASVPPFPGRMSPLALPDGITVMRDDWKASLHTIPPALRFLRDARAERKITILGTIADSTGESRANYVRVARQALEAADLVCFVGPNAFRALRAKGESQKSRLLAFATVKAAAEYLRKELRTGDLVLLKGSNVADHLYRIILSRFAVVACWQASCGRQAFCDGCGQVAIPSDPPSGGIPIDMPDPTPSDTNELRGVSVPAPGSHVVIGLGNPGDEYRNTPHNIGHAVLDRLAPTIGASEWFEEPEAFVARGRWHGEPIWLVKPKAWMNQSGTPLRALARRLGLAPGQCILVFDDHDLPLGRVRIRMRGSDGGHGGVRSILESFQSDEFRRVKVGVRREGLGRPAKEAVLTPFEPSDGAIVDAAVDQALTLLSELVTQSIRTHGPASPRKR
jgi:aminoacyl-tRNA hydrolase